MIFRFWSAGNAGTLLEHHPHSEKRCEMKPYTTIQLNVKVTDTTADQIKRLAAFNQITVAEQLRRFIDEGLAVNSNAQHIQEQKIKGKSDGKVAAV